MTKHVSLFKKYLGNEPSAMQLRVAGIVPTANPRGRYRAHGRTPRGRYRAHGRTPRGRSPTVPTGRGRSGPAWPSGVARPRCRSRMRRRIMGQRWGGKATERRQPARRQLATGARSGARRRRGGKKIACPAPLLLSPRLPPCRPPAPLSFLSPAPLALRWGGERATGGEDQLRDGRRREGIRPT